jgi:glycosyltransferase involved in cell wall biosynthesis
MTAEHVDVIEFPEYEALGLDFQRANPRSAVVVKLHGDTELCLHGDAPAWKRLAYRFYQRPHVRRAVSRERESTARASVVISPSEWMLSNCLRRGWPIGDRGIVVGNPFSGWPAGIEPQEMNHDPRRVLWLARLDRLKGADLLPAIARAVWSEVPEAEFHIIGQQRLQHGQFSADWIKACVPVRDRAKLVYLGGLPYLEVAKRLSVYSLAVFASKWESFGYTELECMWTGMASVSASGGGASELGINGTTHIRTDRTPSAIARAVVDLIHNPVQRERIGTCARAHVLRQFHAATIGVQMTDVYSTARRNAATRASIT